VFDISINKNKLNKNPNNENVPLISLCQTMPNCAETVPNYAETVPNCAESSSNTKMKQNNDKIGVNFHYCYYYCKKNFSSKSTLTRHQKANCKIKKDNDDEKENIFKLLLEMTRKIRIKFSNLKNKINYLKNKISR